MLRLFALLCALLLAALPVGAGQAGQIAGPLTMTDGDTLRIGALRIRLTGIDAPETDQTCRTDAGESWACGAWVSSRAAALFDGRRATCSTEGEDRYGRTLARCTVGGRDMGETLVKRGLAFAYRRYSKDYVAPERAARARKAGLWAVHVQSPEDWRRARSARQTQAKAQAIGQARGQGGCTIKGNISSRGARIYHLPHQEHYAKTRISAAKGERWFCSEAEARAAGWRKSRS